MKEGSETSNQSPKYLDYSFTNWGNFVKNIPPEGIEYDVWQIKEDDYEETVDEKGSKVRLAKPHYISGTLTVSEEPYGWRIKHPGLTDENGMFVSALNCDTSPFGRGIHIRQKVQPKTSLPK